MNTNYITASEIADYIYCKRGWWLKTKGLLKTNLAMEKGTAAHNRLAQLLFTHKWKVIAALILIGLGLAGSIIAFIYTLLFH